MARTGRLIHSSSGPIEYIGMYEPELSEWQKLRQIKNTQFSDQNSDLDDKSSDFFKITEIT